MTPVLKNIYSLEVEPPLEAFIPDRSDYFELDVHLLIGPKNEKGADLFNITICTPAWLNTRCENGAMIFGRHILILKEYNFYLIKSSIERKLSTIYGDSWTEIARKIGDFAAWEFENYQLYDG